MRKLISIFIAITMLLCTVPLCLAEGTTPPQVLYDEVLSETYAYCQEGFLSGDSIPGSTGLSEVCNAMSRAEALAYVGYAFEDLNGDGTPELLIGSPLVGESGENYGNTLYTLYTFFDGSPKLLLEGWARSSYTLLTDGTILYQGSGGAAYFMWSSNQLSADGRSLECLDCFFTSLTDFENYTVGYFHNTTGSWETSQSEQLTMAEDEFWQLCNVMTGEPADVTFTPFGDYAPYGTSRVRAQFVADAGEPEGAVSFTADTSENRTRVLLTPVGGNVTEFAINKLELKGTDQNGSLFFSTTELWKLNQLTPEAPLILELTFYGDTPSYGISFIDLGGTEHRYALNISGYDGTLELIKI